MSDSAEFDLVNEPWIPALESSGRTTEFSLLELFERASEVRSIAGEIPTQDIALLRLAGVVLHRALEPYAPATHDGVAEVVSILAAQWDEVVLPAVRSYLVAHQERFDLFHPEMPFFQVAGMSTAKGEFSELTKLIADMPAGDPYLSARSARNVERISAAEAARWLVHLQAFDASGIKTGVVGHPRAKGGKVYPEGTGWAGQLGIIHLVGPTLKETLLLNLWAVLLTDDARERDLPPWERQPQDLEPSPDLLARPSGPVDLFTWQPRRVLLRGDPQGVTGVLVTYGDRFIIQERQDIVHLEPMTLWRFSKPQTAKYKTPIQMTRKHQPGVALWRGIASVLPASNPSGKDSPDALSTLVDHAGALVRARSPLLRDGVVRYRAVGVEYGSNESVIDDLIEDSLDLPAILLDPAADELRTTARDAVESAKQGAHALADLARGLARASGAGPEQVTGPGDRAHERAYSSLDQPYRGWLRESLARAGSPAAAATEWDRTAWRVIDRLGEELAAAVADKAWSGFSASGRRDDVGAVYERFRRQLRRAFPRSSATVQDDQTDPNKEER